MIRAELLALVASARALVRPHRPGPAPGRASAFGPAAFAAGAARVNNPTPRRFARAYLRGLRNISTNWSVLPRATSCAGLS